MTEENTTHVKVEEIAQKLSISKSQIRFWEEEFELPKRENGSMSHLEAAQIKLIHELIQENGFTLEDAKASFLNKRILVEKRFEILDNLKRIKLGLINLQRII
jgi:DNA-binding transcriptional MerR regulator